MNSTNSLTLLEKTISPVYSLHPRRNYRIQRRLGLLTLEPLKSSISPDNKLTKNERRKITNRITAENSRLKVLETIKSLEHDNLLMESTIKQYKNDPYEDYQPPQLITQFLPLKQITTSPSVKEKNRISAQQHRLNRNNKLSVLQAKNEHLKKILTQLLPALHYTSTTLKQTAMPPSEVNPSLSSFLGFFKPLPAINVNQFLIPPLGQKNDTMCCFLFSDAELEKEKYLFSPAR